MSLACKNSTTVRRAIKGVLGGGVLLAALVYLGQALAWERIVWFGGGVQLQTGDFHWIWIPSPRSLLVLIEALGILGLIFWPARRDERRLGPLALGVAAVTIAIAPALVLMQALAVDKLEPSIWAFALVLGGSIFWLLHRPGPAGAMPAPRPAARLAAWAVRAGGGAALPWAAAAAGAAVMLVSWRDVFQGQPIVTDSQSQIAQARLLLSGHWRLEISQALRDVICFPYATRAVPSFSQYPPGYILPLMGALALRLPAQAVDVAAAALLAGVTALLARRVAGGAAALAAVLLLLGSPFFMAVGGSGMNHALCAALLGVAALCFVPAGPARTAAAGARLGLLGGLCLGWVMMTRPVTGLAHAAVWGGVLILRLRMNREGRADQAVRAPGNPHSAFRIPHLIWALAGAALPMAILLYYNYRTTGHPLVLGYQVSDPELHRLGFHGGRLAFTPAQAWHRLAANVCSLNFNLFGWAAGSWTVLGIWLARSRMGRGERALLALILAQTGLYTIYQFHDLFLGPRFLFELLPAFAVLGGAGLAPVLRRGGARGGTVLVLAGLASLGGLAGGRQYWAMKIGRTAGEHAELEQSIQAALPLRGPTVMVLDERKQGEMIGRHFEWGKLWFVTRENEAAARRLPELAGWNWVRLKE